MLNLLPFSSCVPSSFLMSLCSWLPPGPTLMSASLLSPSFLLRTLRRSFNLVMWSSLSETCFWNSASRSRIREVTLDAGELMLERRLNVGSSLGGALDARTWNKEEKESEIRNLMQLFYFYEGIRYTKHQIKIFKCLNKYNPNTKGLVLSNVDAFIKVTKFLSICGLYILFNFLCKITNFSTPS